MSKHILMLLCSVLLLASCKKDIVPTSASTTSTTVGAVRVDNLDFAFLSSKAQVTLNDRNDNLSSGVSIRMQKDSVIWVSVLPGLGIEAARLMFTQDSVYFMNRLKKEYAATDYRFLRSKLQVDVTFEVLQAILLGNYQATSTEKVMAQQDSHHIQQQRQNITLDYFVSSLNNKLQQLNAKDISTGSTITVKYNNFAPIGRVPFAHELVAQVLQKGEVSDFTLKHSRVTVSEEPLTFPFGVPSDYTRLAF